MKPNVIKLAIILAVTGITCFSCNDQKKEEYIVIDGFAQGGTYHIVYQKPQNKKISLKDSLDLYFEQINKSVSGYDSLSIISRFNNGEDVIIDSIFKDIFNDSYKIYKESGGYFDVSAGPLFDAWGFGFKNKESITQKKLDSILNFIGMDKIHIQGDKIKKDNLNIRINFNAIAQGYTCDYIADKLNMMGIQNYLIEVGGEVYCKGYNANKQEWRVGIDKPIDGNFLPGQSLEAIVLLSNKGLVTSGNYRKYYIENGEKYSHTLNPKTGYPVKHNLLSVTVIADNATIADAYATYFMVIGLEEAKEVIKNMPGIDALFVYGDNEQMYVYSTPGVKTIQEP